MPSDRAVNGITALCAIGILAVFAFTRLPSDKQPISDEPPEGMSDQWPQLSGAGSLLGNSAAPVIIVELGDYQCPSCRAFHTTLAKLEDRFGDSVAVRYVHFPLPGNSWSHSAARAAECARTQGKFGEYHSALMETPGPFSQEEYVSIATSLRLDSIEKFTLWSADTASVSAIADGTSLGEQVKLRRTPTIFVNGWRFNGPPSFETLEARVSREIRRARTKR